MSVWTQTPSGQLKNILIHAQPHCSFLHISQRYIESFFAVMNSTELFFCKMQIGTHPWLEINMINSKMSPDNLYQRSVVKIFWLYQLMIFMFFFFYLSLVVSADGLLWMGLTDDNMLFISTARAVTLWHMNYTVQFWALARSRINRMELCGCKEKTTRLMAISEDSR